MAGACSYKEREAALENDEADYQGGNVNDESSSGLPNSRSMNRQDGLDHDDSKGSDSGSKDSAEDSEVLTPQDGEIELDNHINLRLCLRSSVTGSEKLKKDLS